MALLSLALLPLGAIATWQTQRSAAQAARGAETALLSMTQQAVDPLQNKVDRAFGVLEGLAPLVAERAGEPEACGAALAGFVEAYPEYSFVGLVPPDGLMTCSSSGAPFDFTGFASFEQDIADPRPRVSVIEDAPISGIPVMILSVPILIEEVLAGLLSASMPLDRIAFAEPPTGLQGPLGLLTFNARGEILTSTLPQGEREAQLPQGRALDGLVGRGAFAFSARNAAGDRRAYAVAPIEDGALYALASWPQDALARTRLERLVLNAVMPLTMWAASLVVAFIALDRLVIRHIRILSRQLRAFARTRRLVREPMLGGAGHELADIEADFREMARAILQEEAQLEDSLRQKNVLLKEVHHRVKNNLQLISSIMNMQIRRSTSPEAAEVLRRLQDRIMSIATVHRSLYQSDNLERVDAGRLLPELARHIIVAAQGAAAAPALALDVEADGILMGADQAVPLSLLTSEAMTNAVQHAPDRKAGADEVPIRLRLRRLEGARALLEVENLRAVSEEDGAGRPGLGLGTQLIRAFASQLEGRLEVVDEDGRYRVALDFPVKDEEYRPLDY